MKKKKCPACKQRDLFYRNGLPLSKYCSFCRKIKAQEKKEKHQRTKGFQENLRKKDKKLCDRLWIEAVKKKYGIKCIICASTKINIHHIVGRRNRSVRWYTPNGVPLCSKCHVFDKDSAHQNPLLFRKKIVELRGVEWETDLINKASASWDKDIDKIKKYLQ